MPGAHQSGAHPRNTQRAQPEMISCVMVELLHPRANEGLFAVAGTRNSEKGGNLGIESFGVDARDIEMTVNLMIRSVPENYIIRSHVSRDFMLRHDDISSSRQHHHQHPERGFMAYNSYGGRSCRHDKLGCQTDMTLASPYGRPPAYGGFPSQGASSQMGAPPGMGSSLA